MLQCTAQPPGNFTASRMLQFTAQPPGNFTANKMLPFTVQPPGNFTASKKLQFTFRWLWGRGRKHSRNIQASDRISTTLPTVLPESKGRLGWGFDTRVRYSPNQRVNTVAAQTKTCHVLQLSVTNFDEPYRTTGGGLQLPGPPCVPPDPPCVPGGPPGPPGRPPRPPVWCG